MWGAALDDEQAAAYTSLSVSTMEKLARAGDLPPKRELSKGRAAYLRREIDEWLESRPVSKLLPPPKAAA